MPTYRPKQLRTKATPKSNAGLDPRSLVGVSAAYQGNQLRMLKTGQTNTKRVLPDGQIVRLGPNSTWQSNNNLAPAPSFWDYIFGNVTPGNGQVAGVRN